MAIARNLKRLAPAIAANRNRNRSPLRSGMSGRYYVVEKASCRKVEVLGEIFVNPT